MGFLTVSIKLKICRKGVFVTLVSVIKKHPEEIMKYPNIFEVISYKLHTKNE